MNDKITENYLGLNIVRRLLIDKFGEDSIVLIGYLKDKDFVSEEQIAQDTGIFYKSLQKSLIRMQDAKVIVCKKITDETGYITYYWRIDFDALVEYIQENVYGMFSQLISKLEYGEELYYCPSCSIEGIVYYSYEDSLDYQFKCPRCGSDLKLLTIETIENLKEKILK